MKQIVAYLPKARENRRSRDTSVDNVVEAISMDSPPSDVLHLATCPICLGELVRNHQEVGALTFNGQRIEPELYHMGCVTMMLCHKGGIELGGRGGPETTKISWGVSPVTRKPIDGFMRVPTLTDRRGWARFADWRGQGLIPVAELAAVISATLPIDEACFPNFVNNQLGVGEGDSISAEQVETLVVPHLEQALQDVGQCAPQAITFVFLPSAPSKFEDRHEDTEGPELVSGVSCVGCVRFRRSRK